MISSRLIGLVLAAAVSASVLLGTADGASDVEGGSGTVAFLRSPGPGPADDASGLFTVETNGAHLRRLSPRGTRVSVYAWSPDGDRIAYVGSRGSLWIVRRNGGSPRLLVGRSRLRSFALSWSPDGTALAVAARTAGDPIRGWAHLYVVPTDRGEPIRLARKAGWGIAWSPRGNVIANDAGGACLIRPDGTDRRCLGRGDGPRWSADGTLLGVATGLPLGCWVCADRYGGIAVVGADGSNFHLVTTHAYNEYGFAWSPAGRRILYGREDRGGIYVIDADGRNDRRVTSDSPIPSLWSALTWSPDGRSIAYDTDRTGDGDIYVIGADGRGRFQLTSTDDVDVDPSWAPR